MEDDLLSPITADLGERGMYQRNWAWGLLLYTMRHLHAVSCQAETHMRNSWLLAGLNCFCWLHRLSCNRVSH